MTTDVHDLAKRRHVLRLRIYKDERTLATAYPEQAEQLERNLESERAQLAELDDQVESAKEEVCQQLRDAVESLFQARDTLAKLNGYFQDPGFKDGIFIRPYLSRGVLSSTPFGQKLDLIESQDADSVKQALLRVTEMRPAPEPEVPQGQLIHEEKLRNERAGLGYHTDKDLKRKEENPDVFAHGHGFRRVRRTG